MHWERWRRAEIEARRYYQLANATTPMWVRLLLAFFLGAIVATAGGIADSGGENLRLLLGLSGIAAGSLTAFVTARVISEVNDRRELNRKARLVMVQLEGMIKELKLWKGWLGQYTPAANGKPDDTQCDTIRAYVLRQSGAANGAKPDFDGMLNDPADAENAAAVLNWFHYFLLHFVDRPAHLSENLAVRQDAFSPFLSEAAIANVDAGLKELTAASAHFARYTAAS